MIGDTNISRTVKVIAVLAVLAAASLAAEAGNVGASTQLQPAAGSPDPAKAVIRSEDVGGASVTHQGYYKDASFPSSISYSREFSAGKVSGTRFRYLDSEAEVGSDASTANQFVQTLRAYFASTQGRTALKKSILGSSGKLGKVVTVRIASPRPLTVSQGFYIVIQVKARGITIEQGDLAVFSLDRILGTLTFISATGAPIPRATLTRISATMAGRFGAELQPKSVAVPTVAGTPQAGQTLTAGTDNWRNGAASFTYQWQHCDPQGANCAAISGAVGPTYVPAVTDVGATIEVTVTASNGYGKSTATSAPVGPISAAPAAGG
jgi:hypothetical protein